MEGKQIGNFRIIEKLGEGGMGVVYKGLDVQLDRPVAIKMLSPELARNPELVQRFQAEARAQANLNHTNIATLYGFLVTELGACMVMEFVEGDSFDQLIRRGGPMNPRDAVPLFKQALLGIGAAHRMGIIHRDIKPANLMLNRQGIVKVMDFGIAKALGVRGMTRTGIQMGTILYMSPEQIQSRTIDVRTDIYALGVTLYEMLCGHVPFESDSDFQIMQDHVNTPPPPLLRYYPYVAREFENVVAKALEKNPDYRFQTVEQFGAALEHPENVPAPTYAAYPAAVSPAPMRSTAVESQPTPVPGTTGFGVAAAPAPGITPGYTPAPSMGLTPPPVAVPGTVPPPPYSPAPSAGFTPPPVAVPGTAPPVPGTMPQAPGTMPPSTGVVAVPAPAGSMRNKVILGAVIAATAVLLAIIFYPKKPATSTAGGGGGGSATIQQSTNKLGPLPPRNDTPNIVMVNGDKTGSDANAATSTISANTPSGKDIKTPRQKPTPTPAQQVKTPSGDTHAQNEQPQQPQIQQPQPQPPQVQQPPPVQQTPPPIQQPQPQPQPQSQQQAQPRSFPVKHRHMVMNGFQSYTFFCGGWLTVRPDGSVTYMCTGTTDPSGRCEKVMFPAGSIKQIKMRAGGELHISTSGMGNWDFYDLNVAGSTAAAYQAIQSLH